MCYPEATALPIIESEQVPEAVVNMFSRIIVSEEIFSDQGSLFTSLMMEEV